MVSMQQNEVQHSAPLGSKQATDKKPTEFTPRSNPLLSLQRSLGNGLIQRLASSRSQSNDCAGGAGCSCSHCANRRLQTKLTVGPVDDPYEREADRVADQVVQLPGSSGETDAGSRAPSIQRIASGESGSSAPEANVSLSQHGGRPLSAETRSFMESRFGADFGHVQLHTDEHAHHTASSLQARAFTYGSHIWLGKGET